MASAYSPGAAPDIAGLLDGPYPQDVADLVGLAAQLCQAPYASITLLDATSEWEPAGGRIVQARPRRHALGAWIATHPGPLVVADTRASDLFPENGLLIAGHPHRFYAGAPLLQDNGVPVGTLYVTDVAPRTISDQQVAALVTLGRQIMAQFSWRQQDAARIPTALSPAQALVVLSRRLIAVQEEERRHLARELHDEIGQALTAIRINLQHVYGALPTAQDRGYVQESIAIVHQLVHQVRTLALDLRPSMLDDLGLISAIRWYLNRQEHRSGLPIRFSAPDDPLELDPTVATACFRIVQESLTNILRHAEATCVTVALGATDSVVTLSIEDDGRGFDPGGATGGGLGLLGMRERAALAAGVCVIHSTAGQGTQVRACFPRGPLPPPAPPNEPAARAARSY